MNKNNRNNCILMIKENQNILHKINEDIKKDFQNFSIQQITFKEKLLDLQSCYFSIFENIKLIDEEEFEIIKNLFEVFKLIKSVFHKITTDSYNINIDNININELDKEVEMVEYTSDKSSKVEKSPTISVDTNYFYQLYNKIYNDVNFKIIIVANKFASKDLISINSNGATLENILIKEESNSISNCVQINKMRKNNNIIIIIIGFSICIIFIILLLLGIYFFYFHNKN